MENKHAARVLRFLPALFFPPPPSLKTMSDSDPKRSTPKISCHFEVSAGAQLSNHPKEPIQIQKTIFPKHKIFLPGKAEVPRVAHLSGNQTMHFFFLHPSTDGTHFQKASVKNTNPNHKCAQKFNNSQTADSHVHRGEGYIVFKSLS